MGVEGVRGLVLACSRPGDRLCSIAGPGCPYTLPIAGEALIRHSIRALAAAAVEDVLLVASADIYDEIAAAVGEPGELGVSLHYRVQPELRGAAAALQAVRDEIAGPVLVHMGDSVGGDFRPLIGGTRLMLAPGDQNGATDDVVAAAMLTPDALAALAPADDGLGGLTLAATLDGLDAETVRVPGIWKFDDTVDGVLDANRMALDRLEAPAPGAEAANARVQGRVSIHPTAKLDGAKLRGPAVIGPGAELTDTYVGPYTSIGAGVRLESVEIEHSIVLPGASIRYPGHRLEASLVGEGATIGRDFGLPSAIRLRVGRGAEVSLS